MQRCKDREYISFQNLYTISRDKIMMICYTKTLNYFQVPQFQSYSFRNLKDLIPTFKSKAHIYISMFGPANSPKQFKTKRKTAKDVVFKIGDYYEKFSNILWDNLFTRLIYEYRMGKWIIAYMQILRIYSWCIYNNDNKEKRVIAHVSFMRTQVIIIMIMKKKTESTRIINLPSNPLVSFLFSWLRFL